MQPIAIAVVHGMGSQPPSFADRMIEFLRGRLARHLEQQGHADVDVEKAFVFEPIHWAPVLQDAEAELLRRVEDEHNLGYDKLRRFMLHSAADAVAYNPTLSDHAVYDAIHAIFARSLARLAGDDRAGPAAPLVVIAHSLGTVLSSNYLWDLQQQFARADDAESRQLIRAGVRRFIGSSPLEHGHTFCSFITMGSPIALWSLSFDQPRFGRPIAVPSPHLNTPSAQSPSPIPGKWLNLFDRDDVIAWPLKPLNDLYRRQVTEDIQVNVGGLLQSWNPLSHDGYWTDSDVLRIIAPHLAELWVAANQPNASGGQTIL